MKSIKVLKRYYSLINVKKVILIFEFIALLVPSILSVLTPIFTANVISSLTVYDFSAATYYLLLNLIIIIISTISYFIYHILNSMARSTISLNLNHYVYENVKANSKIESLSLSVLSGIENCVDFSREFLFKLCFLIKSIILLAIIFYYNALIGLILTAVSFVSVFLLNLTDTKIKNNTKAFGENQQKTLHLFNSIKLGSEEERTFNIEHSLKGRYFNYVSENIKIKQKIANYYFINNNLISFLLKLTVFALMVYLITLVRSTVFTLSLYLIFTPYLTYAAENLIAFFGIFAEIGEIDNTLSELESIKFQETKTNPKNLEFESYELVFYNTSLLKEEKNKQNIVSNLPSVKNINLHFEFGKSYLILGSSASGKRTLFYLLNKKLTPSSGSIFIDSKNIFDIPDEKYKQIISFTNKKPHFYNISISENLLMVCSNRSQVLKSISAFGLKEYIQNLPNKLNTIIDNKISSNILFFLGILRAFLSGSKILVIYEIPDNFQKLDFDKLKKILEFLNKKCLVIIFSHEKTLSTLTNKTITIENGKTKS